MTHTFIKHALLSSSILVGLSASSFALDAEMVSERLKKAFLDSGSLIEFSAVKADGDNFVLEGAKVTSADQSFPLGTLLLNDLEELDDGSLRIGKTIAEDVNYQEEDMSFTLTGIEIDGLRLPAEGGAHPYMLYDRAVTGPATFTQNGVDVFKISGSEVDIDISDSIEYMKFDGSVNGIVIDLAAVKDPRGKAAIAEMGYEKLRGDVAMKGDWDAQTGRINMPEYALTLTDAGRINIALDISGYTPELIKQLQEIQQQMGANSDPKAQQAAGMASLGLMQQLTLNGMSIRFDDASLTEKALAFAGKQQGMSAEQMAQTAKALLPFGLARLGMPELQQQITAAASAFLDDPRSLEIRANPPAPVPFGQIMGAAMADHTTIPATIGVEVIANQ